MSDLNHCPICGARVENASELIASGPGVRQHRCRKKVLECIDGALSSEKPRGIREPSIGQRLEDGFSMMEEED